MASSALDLLVRCAQAIRDGNLKDADSLLEQIWELADHESDESQSEIVRFFAEALVRRAYGLHSAGAFFGLHLPWLKDYYLYCDCDYFVRFAIINAAIGKKQLHLIQFDFPDPVELHLLCRSISVRVSVILPTIIEKTIYVQNQSRLFNEQTKMYGLETVDLKIVYANSLGEVDASMLDFRRTKDEAVVICYWFKLHQLLAETGAMERELLKLRHINPETVIILDRDADHNNSDFIKRLQDSFQYYSNVFDLFDGERNHWRQEIHNIVGCEGRDRIVRYQTLAQWQSHLQSAGFLPFPLQLPKSMQDDDPIHEHNGSAVFTLQNRPFFFLSAWKHTDKENHFNPTRSNFAEGFNPSPLLEDRVQPLQPFPEGSSLNRLAALVEIYDMLENICFTYDLPFAIIWTCGSKVNEIMSHAYKKRTLFIQSTFCYWKESDWEFQQFLKCCEEEQPLEGQAIAGKALQSNEDFHFESSTSELEKLDCPLADICAYLPSSSSVMAICLHDSNAMDADYVVEFFLPTSETSSENPKSLAFRIFNDLKNMKKRFVTVGVRVIQGRSQEKAIPNISQVTVPRRNPPPASSTNYLPYSNTGDSCEMEIQELNEQARGKHAVVNNLLTSSAKRRKLTSNVWDEFTKKEDGDEKICAICAHCSRKFDGSSTKGTTHLRNHLKRCKSRPTNVRDQQLILPVGRDDSKNESARERNSSFDQDRSSMNFARLIIKRQWPLNIVEDDFFSSFLKELQPMFKLQSQEALSSDIVRVYKEEKQKLFEYFGKISCRFNFTISVWRHDFQKTTYCCYAVQFIDDNWELKKKILALKSLGNQFDKRIFYENFKNFLMDWNLDKKVCSLTIQNFSSCFDIDEEIRKNWHCFEASHPLSTFYISCDKCIRGLLGKDDNSVENVGKSNGNVIRTSNECLLELRQQEKIGYPLMDVKSDNNWRTCSLVLAIAAVLDPRFKFDFVEFYYRIYDNDAARIQLRMIRNALTGIFDEYASNMYRGTSISNDINSSTFLNAEKNTVESFHRWYNSKRSVNSEDSWKSELDKYVHEPIIFSNPEFDILGWW